MLIRTSDRTLRANIHIDRILYVETMGNNVTFHMKDLGQIVCYMSLLKVQELFPALERVSAFCLINESELRSVRKNGGYYYLKLSSGDQIKVSYESVHMKAFIKKFS